MATTIASGTQTATVTTEHTLATDTTTGTFVVMVNLTNMVGGTTPDEVEVRVKTKVLTGDTAEVIYKGVWVGDQGEECIVASPPIVSMFSIAATLKQTTGTSRTFAWSLLQL